VAGSKLFLLFSLILFTSCSLLQSKDELYKKKSLQLQEIINNGDGATLYSQLSPGFQKGFPPPMVSAFLGRIYSYCGRLLELGEGSFEKDKYILYPQFSSNSCFIKFMLNDEGQFNYLLIDRQTQNIPEIQLSSSLSLLERAEKLSSHYFKSSEMRGLAVGVIDGSKVDMFFFGDGGDESIVLNEQSYFQIGSVSKLYNALLALKLSYEKQIELDAALTAPFPKKKYRFWSEKNKFSPKLSESILHLSGLPRLPLNLKGTDDQPYGNYTLSNLYAGLRNVHLDSEPGSKFLYSNWGATLAGQHISLVMKRSYDDLITNELLKPFGMNDSFSSDISPQKLVWGFQGKIRKDPWKLGLFLPAGGIASNLRDQLIFLNHAIKARSDEDHWLFQSFEIQKVINSHNAIAFGWLVRGPEQERIYWHNGGTGSFSSFLGLKGSKGIVILSNTSNVPVTELGFKILE
jgi:CubicO group peptidase (beta-lactamase class C family)